MPRPRAQNLARSRSSNAHPARFDRTVLIALFAGLAGIATSLLILTKDECALEPAAPSARATRVALVSPRSYSPLEVPVPFGSDQDAPIDRKRAEPRSALLHGRVIDVMTQGPIAGALFRVGDRSAHTDERGEFRFDQGTVGSAFVVEAEGYCELLGRLEADAMGSVEVTEFTLLASSPVEGRVIDSDGFPVPGAAVRTFALPTVKLNQAVPLPQGWREGWRLSVDAPGVRVVTDEDGRFRLPSLVPHSGNVGVHVQRPGFVSEVQETVAAETGVTTYFEVVLEHEQEPGCGEVVGIVHLNGESAAADVWWESTSRSGKEATGKNGVYRLENLEPGVVRISASPASWQASEGELEIAGATASILVVAGERTIHELELVVPMAAISGRVIHEGGKPSVGRTVMAESSIDHVFQAVTNSEGHYRIEVPDLDEPFHVQPGVGIGTPSCPDVLPGAMGVDFVLPELSDLVLLVRDAATAAEFQRYALFIRRAGEREAWEAPQFARNRDADGFRFRSLLGAVDLKIQRRGYATRVLEDVIVLPGSRTRIDIELESVPVR